MSDAQIATILFGFPFLILAASWLVGLAVMFRPAQVKKERV